MAITFLLLFIGDQKGIAGDQNIFCDSLANQIELLATKLITSAKPRIAVLADKRKFAAKGRGVGDSTNFCSQGSNCWRSKTTFAGNDL